MIRQLVNAIVANGLQAAPSLPQVAKGNLRSASDAVLSADPLDLVLYIDQCWDNASTSGGPARRRMWEHGRFYSIAALQPASVAAPGWDHLASSFVLENTRAVQILRRVVRQFRAGEDLGIPSAQTGRWLEASDVLLTASDGLVHSINSTSNLRPDPEATRRNAYWRLLGMDLAFGTEDNQHPSYDKPNVANTDFVARFEDLLSGFWRAIANSTDGAAYDDTDIDHICDLAVALQSVLASRRQGQMLDRTELAAAAVLGWVQLTLASDTPVVADLGAQADSPAARLMLIGDRVGLPAHAKSAAFFSMARDLSMLLRVLESAAITPDAISYACSLGPLRDAIERVITEWSTATGRDLKLLA